MTKLVQILLILCPFVLFAQEYLTVESVPNPKTENGGYVANPDAILSNATQVEINQTLATLESENSFQVALVCLNSIGSNVPKDFATKLFNHWKIGHANKDDGLLIFLVLDQRRIEFETGYGTEQVLTDGMAYSIQQDYMVPEFKNGNYDQGILSGVNAVARHLEGKTITENIPNRTSNYEDKDYSYTPPPPFYTRMSFWVGILGWHLIYIISFVVVLLINRFKYDPYKKYQTIWLFDSWIWFIVFPLAHILLFWLVRRMKDRYRNMVRFSHETGEIMHKLTEEEDDKFLEAGQITEEIIKSIDYDVWITEDEKDIRVLPYRPSFFSKYSKCPSCNYKTYYKVYDRQTVAPSYSSSGQGEKKHSCAHCKHTKIKTYTIPRLRRSSRTSSSGGWSGSSGGSISSGGGSWGGGFSGGGGAGSSW